MLRVSVFSHRWLSPRQCVLCRILQTLAESASACCLVQLFGVGGVRVSVFSGASCGRWLSPRQLVVWRSCLELAQSASACSLAQACGL